MSDVEIIMTVLGFIISFYLMVFAIMIFTILKSNSYAKRYCLKTVKNKIRKREKEVLKNE